MLYLGRVQVKVKEAYYADKQFNSAVTFFHWLVKWFIIWFSKCFLLDPLLLTLWFGLLLMWRMCYATSYLHKVTCSVDFSVRPECLLSFVEQLFQ